MVLTVFGMVADMEVGSLDRCLRLDICGQEGFGDRSAQALRLAEALVLEHEFGARNTEKSAHFSFVLAPVATARIAGRQLLHPLPEPVRHCPHSVLG
jgi:hypothetical protein